MSGYEILTGEQIPNVLYPFFWQHGEDHMILEAYMEKIAQCKIKGMCIEARPHPDFAGDSWWSDLDFIVQKARELGMKLWILDDSHFPTGYANGKIKSHYPQYLKWYLDMRRFDIQGPMRDARIDFGTLGKRTMWKEDFTGKILGVYLAERKYGKDKSGDPVKAETLTEITRQMDMDKRLLTLDVPDGAWSIFVVYLTRDGGEEATKDYLNPLVKEATQVLIEEVYESHYRHYKEEFGRTIEGFFSDEPRFGNAKGTNARIGSDMALPWREGLEKELGFEARYLPLLWTPASGEESRIRRTYMDVITKMYHDNFTNVIGEWCREHGVIYTGHTIEDNGAHTRLGYGTGHFFRGQQGMDIAGIDEIGGQIVPGMNYHHDSYRTGGSDGEFYHYALAKLATSAAHLEAKKMGRTMCEAFGLYGWNEGLKMMKWIADHLLVRGVNWFVPHAFSPKAFPDPDCPPHFYAHGHNPQFRYFHIFTEYVNRIAGMFRNGKYPAKVGVYYPAETEWMGECMPVEQPARALTEKQIAFDIVTLDYLKTAEIAEGYYTINGNNFEVLILPWAEEYPSDLIYLVKGFEKSGVQVLFLEEDFKETDVPKVSLDELGTVLSEYRGVICEEEQPELVLGEYERGGRKYYMLFNENTGNAVHTRVNIPGKGNVYRYDAFRDKIYLADHDMMLHLEPYESVIFVETKEILEFSPQTEVDRALLQWDISAGEGWKKVEISDQWRVMYADSFSYPEWTTVVPLNQLQCVQNLEGWEEKTGTVRYETVLRAVDGANVILDLGNVYETAEVFVNDVSAGIRLCSPYRYNLTGLFQDGENKLAIEVTNTLGTSIRDAVSRYQAIEPFGVQGPVQMYMK